MLTVVLMLVHGIVCLFLIIVVLLQTGKGADVAAAFGGSSQTAFGARGAGTLMTKITTASAIIFMLTSMILALISSSSAPSVLEGAAPAETSSTPVPAAGQQAAPATESGTPADEGTAPAGDQGAPDDGGTTPADGSGESGGGS